MERLLVTGGRGFVGSHFVWTAVEAGKTIVVLDDLSGGSPAPMPAKVKFVQGDVGNQELLTDVLEKERIDGVVHFAGKIQVGESVLKPLLYMDINLQRSLGLLEAMRKTNVKHFVFSSTAAVYGQPEEVPIPERARVLPVNPYGASKASLENVLSSYSACYGIHWCALRYFNAAGAHPSGQLCERHEPETHLIPIVIDAALGRRDPLTIFGNDYATEDGTCVRDYIHVCDLADAHLAALEQLALGQSLGAINLGTGTGFSVQQLVEAAAEVIGKKVPFQWGARREGDPAQLVADASLARKRLGFAPKRSDLHTILKDAYQSRK
jgi:UDP-glucose 4-epimerase